MIWYKLKDKIPVAYKTGRFDGKKSDSILVITYSGRLYVVEMYETIHGEDIFRDFYDSNDTEIRNVHMWAEIDLPD